MGYIYLLILNKTYYKKNRDMFYGIYKIGMTNRTPEKRIKDGDYKKKGGCKEILFKKKINRPFYLEKYIKYQIFLNNKFRVVLTTSCEYFICLDKNINIRSKIIEYINSYELDKYIDKDVFNKQIICHKEYLWDKIFGKYIPLNIKNLFNTEIIIHKYHKKIVVKKLKSLKRGSYNQYINYLLGESSFANIKYFFRYKCKICYRYKHTMKTCEYTTYIIEKNKSSYNIKNHNCLFFCFKNMMKFYGINDLKDKCKNKNIEYSKLSRNKIVYKLFENYNELVCKKYQKLMEEIRNYKRNIN